MENSKDIKEVATYLLIRNAKFDEMINYLDSLDAQDRAVFLEFYMYRFCLHCNSKQPRDEDGKLGICYCWKDC
jgi:hypothetical protein